MLSTRLVGSESTSLPNEQIENAVDESQTLMACHRASHQQVLTGVAPEVEPLRFGIEKTSGHDTKILRRTRSGLRDLVTRSQWVRIRVRPVARTRCVVVVI